MKCPWLLCHCCYGLGGWVLLAVLAGTNEVKDQSPKGQQASYSGKCAVWPRLTLSSVKGCKVWPLSGRRQVQSGLGHVHPGGFKEASSSGLSAAAGTNKLASELCPPLSSPSPSLRPTTVLPNPLGKSSSLYSFSCIHMLV